MSEKRRQFFAIVGAGPRGLSVLERFCAQFARTAPATPVTVHVVDPHPAGAGAVWRTDQSRDLLMNTVSSQVTVFTDGSVVMAGPVVEGPSLYEWARFLTLMGPFDDFAEPELADAVLAEARTLGPDDYPTRSLYGHYLRWAFRRVVTTAPAGITVRVHQSRAVALDDRESGQVLRLADGTVLPDLDAVVLALGHTDSRADRGEAVLGAFAREHQLAYVPPANPADLDLSFVQPGETVLLRGLGLNFFDHMALFTRGRGGTFERVGGTLVYRASGREPYLVAGSRRGIPYHSRGANEKGPYGRYFPRLLTAEHVAGLRERGAAGERVDFLAELWPLVSREVESVYYDVLLRGAGRVEDAAKLCDAYLAAATEEDRDAVLDRFGVDRAERWSWSRINDPSEGRRFTGLGEFRGWLLDHLGHDLAEARRGNASGPLKTALDVLRDLRNEIRLAVDHSGLTGASHREHLDRWYTPLNAFLSIGPPASRIEEMIALIRAGILDVLGPDLRITARPGDGVFAAESAVTGGQSLPARVLIEARLPVPDVRRTADPLLAHLLETGQVRPHSIPGAEGGEPYETGAVAVTERPCRVIDARGQAHPRRFAYGVPTEAVHWATAAGIRPGVDSVTLGDSDAIAAALMTVVREGDLTATAAAPDQHRHALTEVAS
ncbi:FAD/NAD(P)-binding protein [Streptomyces sp. NBC_01565]|uniref:FAD/NAD(P)-binding protein n=1 Tax=unclassified Streptomyces TaxID=2593676 RepID=UPI0022598F26|nr:FAD/NAD(P)-binding protein [Streptomyces sp. NBC_01565]MCX4545881.1 FAD/NAD(P)-binding protein [Streptomyces sp. NBC_01565]